MDFNGTADDLLKKKDFIDKLSSEDLFFLLQTSEMPQTDPGWRRAVQTFFSQKHWIRDKEFNVEDFQFTDKEKEKLARI